jgi:hypothetical protein
MAPYLMLVSLLLVGCTEKHWSPTGNGGLPFATAAKDCEFRASAATAGSPDRDSVRAHLERRDVFEKCMLARGFSYVYR